MKAITESIAGLMAEIDVQVDGNGLATVFQNVLNIIKKRVGYLKPRANCHGLLDVSQQDNPDCAKFKTLIVVCYAGVAQWKSN